MRKLATAALSYSAAVFLAHYLLPRGWLLPLAAGLFIVGLLALAFKTNSRLRIMLIALPICAGFLWYGAYSTLFVEPAEELAGETMTVSARVLDFPEQSGETVDVYLRLTQEGLPSVKLLMRSYDGSAADYVPGDEIVVTLRFSSATRVSDVSTDVFTSRGIFLRAYSQDVPVRTGRYSLSVVYFPKYIAKAIRESVDNVFPSDVSHLMKALLTGDKSDLSDDTELSIAMGVSGIMHIVSVSGMHVAFLVGFVSTMSGGRRRRTAAVAIPLILIFIPMAGAKASVVRAGFMQIALLTAPMLKRENDAITSMSAVLMALLVFNPLSAGGVGLQLSFAAMAGIILITPRMSDFLSMRIKSGKPVLKQVLRTVVSSLASTTGALVFSVPLVAVHFGYVSLISPITNLLTLPVMSLCFTFGYAVSILGMILQPLGTAAAWVLSWAMRYVILIVKLLAGIPNAAVYTQGNFVAWWLFAAYVVFFICWLGRGKRGFRPVLPLSLSVIMLCSTIFVMSVRVDRHLGMLTAIDVGQGQSIVLMAGRSTVVIDCGGDYGAGESTSAYLLSNGRRKVDLLVLTHLHSDHVNGVVELMTRVKVATLAIPAEVDDEDEYLPEIVAAAEKYGVELIYISSDILLQSSYADIMATQPVGAATENESGTVVSINVGNFTAVVMGDVNSTLERRLIERDVIPDADLLVVGHHGSKYSTSEELLAALTPTIAVISVGSNSYGHPTSEALSRLAAADAKIYRTDLQGRIEITLD